MKYYQWSFDESTYFYAVDSTNDFVLIVRKSNEGFIGISKVISFKSSSYRQKIEFAKVITVSEFYREFVSVSSDLFKDLRENWGPFGTTVDLVDYPIHDGNLQNDIQL